MAALTGNLRWTVASSVADAAIELGDRAHAVEVSAASLDDATGRGAVAVAAELAATAAVAGDLESGERAIELASGLDGVLWPLRARHVEALVESNPDALADVASGYRVLGYERLAMLADTAVRLLPRAGDRPPRASRR